MKIIETLWFADEIGSIGIVIGEDDYTKKRKAYIGSCSGGDEEADSRHIAAHGSPVMVAQASRLLELLTKSEIINIL